VSIIGFIFLLTISYALPTGNHPAGLHHPWRACNQENHCSHVTITHIASPKTDNFVDHVLGQKNWIKQQLQSDRTMHVYACVVPDVTHKLNL
jgi:hypothetical protein